MSGCDCCDGTTASTPRVIHNRPALDEIRYRSGVHGDFLESMVTGLSRRDRPGLTRLRTRDTDDPTIALLDAWAVVCDVLTFYTERLANESYLRTATDRISLQELGKLLAYRLDPGAAAETHLAFALERPPVLPVPDPPDPGVSPPAVPDHLIVPIGLRVQSTPGPGEKPQTFETVEEIEARPEWSALPVSRTTPYLPVKGRRDVWLAGTGLTLGRGSLLLLASPDLTTDKWDVRVLTGAVEDSIGKRTHVTWARGLGSNSPFNNPAVNPEIFALRKRIAVFGHNAPVWKSMNTEFRTGYLSSFNPVPVEGAEWPFFTAVTTTGTDRCQVNLDGSHPDVVEGSWVVISQDTGTFYREAYQVVEVAELSTSAFAVSGKVTRLTLNGELHSFGTPREVTVWAVSDPLVLAEAPDATLVSEATFAVQGEASQMREGRTLMIGGVDAAGVQRASVVTLLAASALPDGRTQLTLAAAPEPAYVRESAVVFGNIARATHGETVTQLLGSGDSRVPFSSHSLQQGPLTFVPADTPRGTASSLEVRVDGIRWSELDSTFTAGPADRVYVTRAEPDGSVSVVFGDGKRGARPASGSHNLRATYRKGLGAAGNVRADSLSQAIDRPLGLKGVTNPAPATGGADPEVEAHARISMPLPVRTLGRAVSLMDYADFARAYTGIGKSSATVLTLPGGRTIVVTVLTADGTEVPLTTRQRLEGELRRSGDPHVPVLVVPGRLVPFRIALKVKADPAYVADDVMSAVETHLRSTYAAGLRELGTPVHRSALVSAAAGVPGVVGIDLDLLYRTTPGLALRLLADPASPASPLPLGVQLLHLSPDPFDWLMEMPS